MAWYQAQFERGFLKLTGNEFESYVTRILRAHHPGFTNPRPTGQLGDFGCDGLTYLGDIAYACFGYLQGRGEKELEKKVRSDFSRAVGKWQSFTTWRFVTNAGPGPLTTQAFIDLRLAHAPGTARPLTIDMWDETSMWEECASKLPSDALDRLFPGVPEAADIQLSEISPLLVNLGANAPLVIDSGLDIRQVPSTKTEFNKLRPETRYEFQIGREHADRIEAWYSAQTDPTMRDRHAARFNEVYRTAAVNSDNIVEALYIALGGQNFRLRTERANAVYAIVAYFFDACDIFEEPPPGWRPA